MKLWISLCQSAGFSGRWLQIGQIALLSASAVGLVIFLITGVPGLGISLGLLTLGVWLEVLRLLANRRQRLLDEAWPAVFDLLRSGAQSGMSLEEQVAYLAESGPKQLRSSFAQLASDLERGASLEAALVSFRDSLGSRSGDYLALVLAVATELGGRGVSQTWEQSAKQIRYEMRILNEVKAKQNWILASAKLALLAPWLLAMLLLSPAGNREAFASLAGTMVLLIGLLMSAAAYFLTNLMGRLKLPGRIFHAL